MEYYNYIVKLIPPTTFYNLAAIFFTISITSMLVLIVKILWKKFDTSEVLKYEFITIIAHKFRTPLTHVKWYTGELINSEQDHDKKGIFQIINDSNEKLIKLTNALMELTNSDNESVSSYGFEVTPLCDFVNKISEGMKKDFLEKNISLSIKCPPENIKAKIDQSRMDFVIQTILENAVAYTPSGQNVEVNITYTLLKVFISITDNGIGIKKEDLPLLFTKFFRTKNAKETDTEGFGIGLYLAQSIVRRHKGSIKVDSPGLGAGSTFTIILPRVY